MKIIHEGTRRDTKRLIMDRRILKPELVSSLHQEMNC